MSDEPTPIFGLTTTELWPVVESVAGEAVESFSVAVHEQLPAALQGGDGEYVIPTISYTCSAGRTGTETIFVKRQQRVDLEDRESPHYEYLSRYGAPIPKFHGHQEDSEGRQITFLERLVWFEGNEAEFLAQPDRLRKFLAASARFKAVPISDDYADRLGQWDLERTLIPDTWLPAIDSIWAAALRGELGPELERLCTEKEDRVPLLRELASTTLADIQSLPQGLNHCDHRLGNAGWRRGTGEMVFYDLGVFLGPRFDDVTNYLGGDGVIRYYSSRDHYLPRCISREEAALHFLGEFERAGGGKIPLGDLLAETHTLWLGYIFNDLPGSLEGALHGTTWWPWQWGPERTIPEWREDLRTQLLILLEALH